jgi:hypothetical protein
MTSGAVQPPRTGSSGSRAEKWRRIARRITLRHDSRLIAKHRIEPQVRGVSAGCSAHYSVIVSICLPGMARICGASTAVTGQILAIGPVLLP